MTASVFTTLVRAEFGHFLHHTRALQLLPAAFLAVGFTSAHQPQDPYLPAMLAAFCGLETQFNAAFARTREEAGALHILPVRWSTVLAAKNAATILLTGGTLLAMAAICAPFLHRPPTPGDLADMLGHAGAVVFLLLTAGNHRSLREYRPDVGWQITDLTEAFGMLVTAVACSVPYWILREVGGAGVSATLCTTAGLVLFGLSSRSAAARNARGGPLTSAPAQARRPEP